MDGLRSEAIGKLLEELPEENGTQESPPQDIDVLLHVLQSGSTALDRRDSAEQLGKVRMSSPRILRALTAACESDRYREVRRAAAKSLQAPVHQEYLQRELSLAIHARVAGVMTSLPPGNPRYWLLASLYAPALIGVTYIAFVVEGNWRFWIAGAVWFIGGCLGLYVLKKKGHGALIEKHLSKLEGPDGWGLFLLAVVGPFLLLAALLARIREPGYDFEAEPEEQQQQPALAEATEKALLIPGSDRGSERLRPMDADQLIQRYASGERNFKDVSLREVDLRGVDLSGADLSGANLYGADLRNANLSRADLRNANLYGADLRKACLYKADLREANLYGAELSGANLGGANLHGADLSGADLHGADLRSTDLTGAFLQGTGVAQEQLAQAASLKGTTVQDSPVLGKPWQEVAVPILVPILSLAVTGLLYLNLWLVCDARADFYPLELCAPPLGLAGLAVTGLLSHRVQSRPSEGRKMVLVLGGLLLALSVVAIVFGAVIDLDGMI